MGGVTLVGDGASFALQTLAREQMKHKLLTDITVDLQICQLEGWPYRQYLRELHDLIAGFDPCEVHRG